MTNEQGSILQTFYNLTLRLVEMSTAHAETSRIAMEKMNQVHHLFKAIITITHKTHKGWKY